MESRGGKLEHFSDWEERADILEKVSMVKVSRNRRVSVLSYKAGQRQKSQYRVPLNYFGHPHPQDMSRGFS